MFIVQFFSFLYHSALSSNLLCKICWVHQRLELIYLILVSIVKRGSLDMVGGEVEGEVAGEVEGEVEGEGQGGRAGKRRRRRRSPLSGNQGLN